MERTSILVNSLGELVDDGRDFEALEEHALLPLELNVPGPADKAGQIALGLDIATNTEVAGALLEEDLLGLTGLGNAAGNGLRARGGFLGGLGLDGNLKFRAKQRKVTLSLTKFRQNNSNHGCL